MTNNRHALIVVLTTLESRQDADQLATSLVDQSLVACAQIEGPIISHYRWAGEVQCSEEYRLVLKSTRRAWPQLHDRLAKLHPYEEPQIIMLHVADASEGYRAWVTEQTT